MELSIEPYISIVVPIFNSEKYLEQCISSILGQTFQNFELILINDGSLDNSQGICDKFARDNPQIKMIHKQNEGVSVARNLGIKVSSGKWVMFVDSDDFLEPSILEELISTTDDNTDIVSCCCNVFSDDFKQIDYFYNEDKIFVSEKDKTDLYLQLLDNSYGQPQKAYTAIGVPWGKLYRKDFLERNALLFNSKMRRLQDNLFNMYAFNYANIIKYTNKPLYNYRYDHMEYFYKKNSQAVIDIFHTVAKERYLCLSKFGLLNNEEIRNSYRVSVLKNVIDSIQYGVFLNTNIKELSQRRKLLNEIRGLEYFKSLFEVASVNDFKHLRYKISFCVLKNRWYIIFYVLFCFDRIGKNRGS